MGQQYKIFRKKKKIRHNIMKLEKKYKSTKNKIKISQYDVKHEENMYQLEFKSASIHKHIF